MNIERLPYIVTLLADTTAANAQLWCEKHIGERWGPGRWRNGNWTAFVVTNRPESSKIRFFFANEKDAMVFKLRWS